MRSARIFGVINPMAKAWNLLLLCQQALYILDRIGARGINCLQNEKHSSVRAAVQRPLQRANCRRDSGMHIRQSRSGNARGKRGSVEFVVGMQDQSDIESTFGGR